MAWWGCLMISGKFIYTSPNAAGNSATGNARDNYLYGGDGDDTMDGGAGTDYLRGYQGDDRLWGGTGADRFVFERTQASNGVDTIQDFEFGVDIIDLSLVGFARNAFSGGLLDQVLRMQSDGNGNALFLISLNGTGDFSVWAVLNNAPIGSIASVAVGSNTYSIPVI